MRLVVSEKNIAAKRIAEILAVGTPKSEKIHTTPVYTFKGRDGEEWVSIGLKGHIMAVDFPAWVEELRDGSVVSTDAPDAADEAAGRRSKVVSVDGKFALTKWSLEALPVLVKAPILKLAAEKGIIQSLKSLAKKADDVIIATDFDREGELIGADARDIVRSANKTVPVSRVRFSAITRDEIQRAFAEPGTISEELAQAGESRQEIDLVWGATLTRFMTLALQKKNKKPFGDVLSAGRVQTPTLKLIVDREAERDAFVSEDYWTVKGDFDVAGTPVTAASVIDRFTTEAAAQAVLDAVEGATSGTVVETKNTRRKVDPPVPFNTTSLMAVAANEGLSPARTMQVAESLYMSGYISYPRVDNTVYPPSLDLAAILHTLAEVPAYREQANRILGGKLTPTRGPKETTDHPPIHPTGAGDPDKLDGQAWKIYNLVARRFMATLSGPAFIEATRVDIDVQGQRFAAKGDVVVSPGFRAVYTYGLKKDEHLPPMARGDVIDFLGARMEAKQTQPPARYSAGKLIQEMERLGLGTKATRHDIIQTLADRKYVRNEPIEPTNKGISVIAALTTHAARITTPDMTSELDAEMDAIAEGRDTQERVVDHSRKLLGEVIGAVLEHVDDVSEKLMTAIDEDARLGACPVCGKDLLIKFSPKNRSSFVGCSGYPECSQTYPLPRNVKFEAVEGNCETCGTPRVKLIQFKRKPAIMCLNPECPAKKTGPVRMVGTCPTCKDELWEVRSKFEKRYVQCKKVLTGECKVMYPLPQSGDIDYRAEPCEQCGAPVVTTVTKKGPWTRCVNPECPSNPPRKSFSHTGNKKATARPAARKKTVAKRKPAAKKKPADA